MGEPGVPLRLKAGRRSKPRGNARQPAYMEVPRNLGFPNRSSGIALVSDYLLDTVQVAPPSTERHSTEPSSRRVKAVTSKP